MADFTLRFYEEAPAHVRPKYAVIIAKYQGQLLWCRHKQRTTWEIPGGHIEAGESAIEAAARELQEETGATDFRLTPLCWYNLVFEAGYEGSASLLCMAEVSGLGELHSEMAEVRALSAPPDALTYPDIQPCLLAEAKRRGQL